jgi:hypothetical protein
VALLLAIGIAIVERRVNRGGKDGGSDTATRQAAGQFDDTKVAAGSGEERTAPTAVQNSNGAEIQPEGKLVSDNAAARARSGGQSASAPANEASTDLSYLDEPLVVETSDSVRAALPAIGPAALGGEAPSALDMLDEPADRPELTADWASTSMFGVEAKGRKFVYVFDRSGSMGEPANRPLAAAKAELIQSLERLESVHQFHLIFYNTETRVFNPTGMRGRLVFGTDENKEAARRFIASIPAEGGTNHYDPLLVAARLRADVIFLLTDGEQKDDLAAEELGHIRRVNDGIAQIHVIQFASTPYASNSLKQLAAENRGQHTYYDIRKAVER